jgi:hypothetical protein
VPARIRRIFGDPIARQVRERWRSFANFYADVGKRPSWRHLVIRDDPTGAFEPGHARWQVARRYRRRRPSARTR